MLSKTAGAGAPGTRNPARATYLNSSGPEVGGGRRGARRKGAAPGAGPVVVYNSRSNTLWDPGRRARARATCAA